MTQEKPTPQPDRPATPSCESNSSSSSDDTEDEGYVSCFLKLLSLDLYCKRILHDEMKMLAHHKRKIGNKAIPIFQQAVNEDSELFMEAWAQIALAIYAMSEVIV